MYGHRNCMQTSGILIPISENVLDNFNSFNLHFIQLLVYLENTGSCCFLGLYSSYSDPYCLFNCFYCLPDKTLDELHVSRLIYVRGRIKTETPSIIATAFSTV